MQSIFSYEMKKSIAEIWEKLQICGNLKIHLDNHQIKDNLTEESKNTFKGNKNLC
jgi:hypothetical protein